MGELFSLDVMLGAVVVSVLCALCGVWLVLRRMSLYGDVLSHSLLLSLALAFLITGSRSVGASALMSVIIASIGGWGIIALQRRGLAREDGAMAALLSVALAAGILLVSTLTAKIDIDQSCILYGELVFIPLEQVVVAGYTLGAKAIWVTLPWLAAVMLATVLFHRLLGWVAFDPRHAQSLGIPTAAVDIALLAVISVVMVVCFELVGALLVIAMMVVPAIAARAFSRTVRGMIAWAPVVAALSAIVGTIVATLLDGAVAPTIVIIAASIAIAGAFLKRV